MTTEQQTILKELAQMGDVVFVRQDGSREILNDAGKVSLQTQEDAILYFIERLDSNMLELILNDDHLSQEFDKRTFLKKLANVFGEFSKRGNTFLNRFEGRCMNCVYSNPNCKGFSFIGNKSNDFMDLILETKGDKVIDIYECSQFCTDSNELLRNHKISMDEI